jgi:glucose-6-phosphate isomerase
MTEYMSPFTRTVDLSSGIVTDALAAAPRRLSTMRGLFADAEAEAALLPGDPLVYEVFEATDNPEEEGQLKYSTTLIHPGKVGDEYFMTKGHYHAKGDRAELYFGLKGEGVLLLQTPDGVVDAQPMQPGSAAYVPPYWGHRAINVGKAPFVFLAVYPADAGYDYKTIEERGFASILVERNGKPELVPNPRYGSNDG